MELINKIELNQLIQGKILNDLKEIKVEYLSELYPKLTTILHDIIFARFGINVQFRIDNLTSTILIETENRPLYKIKIQFINTTVLIKPQEIEIKIYDEAKCVESINNYKL